MQLYLNSTSPYARVTRIVVLEKGLADQVELVWCDPWANDPALLAVSPVARIPALVTPEGITLTESLLICHYLDQLSGAHKLIVSESLESVYSVLGLAQGLMDAAFNRVISAKYLPGNEISILDQRREQAIERIAAQLNTHLPDPDRFTLAEVALVVALDYIQFRLPQLEIAKRFEALEAWRAALATRPAFQATTFA